MVGALALAEPEFDRPLAAALGLFREAVQPAGDLNPAFPRAGPQARLLNGKREGQWRGQV